VNRNTHAGGIRIDVPGIHNLLNVASEAGLGIRFSSTQTLAAAVLLRLALSPQ